MAPKPFVITSKKCPTGAVRSRSQCKRRRPPIAAQHHHAVADAGPGMAWRTEDVVTLLAARHHGLVHRERETRSRPRRRPCRCRAACLRAVVPRATVPSTGARAERPSAKKVDSRSGMYFGWSCMSCRHPVSPSSANTTINAETAERAEPGLSLRAPRASAVIVVAPAQSATVETSRGLSVWRKYRVVSRSNFGSLASMQRKNRLRLASANRDTLKTG